MNALYYFSNTSANLKLSQNMFTLNNPLIDHFICLSLKTGCRMFLDNSKSHSSFPHELNKSLPNLSVYQQMNG